MRKLCLLFIAAGVCFAQPSISGEHIRTDVQFLSSDLLEGRGVGARGGELATEYIATQFALAGLRPAGDNGTYFQRVPLVGVDPQPSTHVEVTGKGQPLSFEWLNEIVGVTQCQRSDVNFDAEAVFVGHGIVAPEFQWNDYKGIDVRGKVVVMFTNEPTSNDPKFFGGPALTYYGRWTYKYEEALRQGALAVLIIHTKPTAGYGWSVVRNSWAKEDPQVRVAPGAPALAFAGWVSEEAGGKLLALAGHSVAELVKLSDSRDFHAFSLGFHVRGHVVSKVRDIESRNVAGIVPGSDPKLASEAVIFSAHWDHLGIGTPVNGDAIYNGAVDNGTGCGILLELARAWAALPQKPRRSALFLAVTAEEAGLRGSQYYAEHPLIPPGKTAIDLNYDAIYPAGRMKDFVVAGAERTTVWPLVQNIARRVDLAVEPNPSLSTGAYFRSDHFSFAKAGIPAFSVGEGHDYFGKPSDPAQVLLRQYGKDYHQPSDEFHKEWDFSGLAQLAQYGMLVAIDVANADALPTWNAGDEFLPAREKSVQ